MSSALTGGISYGLCEALENKMDCLICSLLLLWLVEKYGQSIHILFFICICLFGVKYETFQFLQILVYLVGQFDNFLL